jgi:hypothetical protein
MARQRYQRLSPADIDEIWSRLRAGHAVSLRLERWACRPARCGPT